MEFFIPGLLLFLISIAISFAVVPKFTPLIAAVLSIVFLTFGVYQHYKMFAYEYRLSTWQDNLKVYAPAVMIGATILFVIYAILAFFSRGSVPVPPMPNINIPSVSEATNTITESLNKVANTVTNTAANLTEDVTEAANNVVGNTNQINQNRNKNSKNRNNLSRSILETI
jgi:hypothetical protein